MIKTVLLLILLAAALCAGPLIVGPAAAAGTAFFLARPRSRGRVRLGAGLFIVFFAVLCLSGLVESALRISVPDYGRYAILTLRGYASFLAALAASMIFTLTEVLCSLKKIRVPGYILTMIYLMISDLAVFNRLASEIRRTVRSRADGRGFRVRLGLTVHAAKSFVIFAAVKFRYRHEHIQARGLSLELPLDDWRASERLRQSA
ncbi:MAG: hypothetical protein JW843_04085 [Candidatus Aminicenantes bacterium]|nr:hypothetical protein [Candidatus Aminicenantes bacterium]